MKTLSPIIPFNSPLRRTMREDRPKRLVPVAAVLACHLVLLAVLAIRGYTRETGAAGSNQQTLQPGRRIQLPFIDRVSPGGQRISQIPTGRADPHELASALLSNADDLDALPLNGGIGVATLPPEPGTLAGPEAERLSLPEADAPASYVVRQGDTLSQIARRHRTTVKALRDANGMTSDFLAVGQELLLPLEWANTAKGFEAIASLQ